MQDDLNVCGGGLDQREVSKIVRRQQAATSMHQAAEQGMHTFQSMFPRVKDTIIHEESKVRKIMLKAMILIFNYCTDVVGINQILNFFNPRMSAVPGLVMK